MNISNTKSKKKSNDDETKKPILMLLVEIGNEEKKYLTIYSDSNPDSLAYEFCLQNNLDFESLKALTNQISEVLTTYKNRDKEIKDKENTDINNKNGNKNVIQNNSNSLFPSKSQSSLNSIINNINKSNLDNRPFTTNYNENFPNKLSNTTKENAINYGERLYHKGMKLQEQKEEKIEKYKNKIEQENKKKCTFKPKINKISYDQLMNRYSNKLNYDDDENILYYKEIKEQKLSNLKDKYNIDEEKYNFAPILNNRSKTMDKKRKNLNKPRYESLYNNYKKKQNDIEYLANKIYNKNTLFKPKINNYDCAYTSITFQERQNFFLSKSAEKQKLFKKEQDFPVDDKTGQKLFHPIVNEYIRPNNKLDIYNNLYNESYKNILKKKELTESVILEEKSRRNLVYVNPESNEIYEKKIELSFKKIFFNLDKDHDGIISKLNVEMKSLPDNIQRIIEPIVSELKEENETLNEQEFIAACFHLFDMINYVDKKSIANYCNNFSNSSNNKYSEMQFSFKPKINEYPPPTHNKRGSNISKRTSESSKNNVNKNLSNNSTRKIVDGLEQSINKSNKK